MRHLLPTPGVTRTATWFAWLPVAINNDRSLARASDCQAAMGGVVLLGERGVRRRGQRDEKP
jgi:hypothetical protein